MHLAQNRFFDKFAIDNHETGVSLRESLQDPFGMGDRGFIGCENPIEDWDLFGVDCPFAAETQVPHTAGFTFHAVGVLKVQIRNIDGIDADAGCRMNDARAGIEQGLPLILATQLGRHVDAAEKDCVDARAGVRNLVRGFESGIGLDNDMQPGTWSCPIVGGNWFSS